VNGFFSCAVGGAVAAVLVPPVTARAPASLLRANVAGRTVPAVLGGPLAAGFLVGLASAERADRATARSVTAVVLVTGLGGLADDLRGDERARGFRGHLRAAAHGRVTGGLVKVAAGGAAGMAAGLAHGRGWRAAETAGLVALAANVVNLLDRAPGRALKASLTAAVPLLARGGPWAAVTCPLWAAAAACLPADLRARAMLGDAGANPLGAALGLGAALSLDRRGRLLVLGALLGLNLASERWSFSRAIERSRLLRGADRLGRANERSGDAVLA
jgi:hypothetical protein